MIKVLIGLLAVYIALVGLLFVMQRKLQYVPDPRLTEPAEVGLDGFDSVRLETPDGERLVAWHALPNGSHPTIVYFQGNGLGLEARADRFRLFHGRATACWRSATAATAARAARPAKRASSPMPRRRSHFSGTAGCRPSAWSITASRSAPASPSSLPAEPIRPAAVILEAPFTSAIDVARLHYWYVPLSLLMLDQFRSIDHVAAISAPLFVLHGEADGIVPVAHGRRMFESAAEPKEMMEISGGSHGMALSPEIWQRMDDFLRRHALAEGAGVRRPRTARRC
jgi:uncharacterized protein